MWYDIQIIDATEHTFNGIAALLPMLIGEIQLREKNNCNEPLQIIKLCHPHDDKGRYFISYGILIDIISIYGLADYSGWLLFYNCCCNFGSMRDSYAKIEEYIEKYTNENKVKMTEIEINGQKFINLMKNRILPFKHGMPKMMRNRK